MEPEEESTYEKKKVTLSGKDPDPAMEGKGAPQAIDPATGMHKDYWVLPAEEIAKGFVRPYRDKYLHTPCGVVTSMGRQLSETYARNPKFYGSTFCVGCRNHYPVEDFVWTKDGQVVGS